MSSMNTTADLRWSVYELFSKLKPKSKPEAEEGDIAEISPDGQFIRYNEILSGEGGVGVGVGGRGRRGVVKTVYKGFDQDYGKEVTWNKVSSLHDDDPSEEYVQRLYSEIQLLKSLKHENIIECSSSWVDEDEDDNKTFNIITESFSSGCLRQFRQKHKSVDMKAIKNWARQILQGLNYLHTHNPPIIHRNLHCGNVFVNGNSAQVKLGYLGSPTEYVVPEVCGEEYNEVLDIYSFGMLMLELVTCEWDPHGHGESKNQSDMMYKNITLGIHPPAIGRVKNLEVKQFIEKCLVPPSLTLSAEELLEDPFLSSKNSKKQLPNSVPVAEPTSSPNSKLSKTMSEVRKNSEVSSVVSCTEVSNDMNLLPSSPSVSENVQCDELKMELDAIDMRYTQHFLELTRMRENEIDNAKKRWISEKRPIFSCK